MPGGFLPVDLLKCDFIPNPPGLSSSRAAAAEFNGGCARGGLRPADARHHGLVFLLLGLGHSLLRPGPAAANKGGCFLLGHALLPLLHLVFGKGPVLHQIPDFLVLGGRAAGPARPGMWVVFARHTPHRGGMGVVPFFKGLVPREFPLVRRPRPRFRHPGCFIINAHKSYNYPESRKFAVHIILRTAS